MALGGAGTGGGRSASDVRAGGAFFEIYAKDGLSGVIDKLMAKVRNFGSFMKRIGGTLFGAGAALGAGPLGFLLGGINRAGDIANLSRQFQIPIDQMARLKYAADAAGASVEDVLKNPGLYADVLREAPGMNEGDAQRAVSIQREWRLTTIALQSAMLSLLDVIMPVIKGIAEFVRQNSGVIVIVAATAAGLVALGLTFGAIGAAVSVAATVATAFGAVLGFLLTPLGMVLGTIAATTIALGVQRGSFVELAQTAKTAWGGIVDAIRAGDFGLAVEIAFTGFKLEWAKVVAFWTDVWNKFKGVFVDGWYAMTTSVRLVWNNLTTAIATAFMWMTDKILGATASIAEALNEIDPTGVSGDLAGKIRGLQSSVNEGARDELRRERDQVEKELMQAHSRAQKAREDARAKDLAEANAEIAMLQNRLETLREQAARGVPAAPAMQSLLRAAEATKGMFGSDRIQQSLGYGDKAGIAMLKDIRDGKGGLPDAIGAAVAASLVVR